MSIWIWSSDFDSVVGLVGPFGQQRRLGRGFRLGKGRSRGRRTVASVAVETLDGGKQVEASSPSRVVETVHTDELLSFPQRRREERRAPARQGRWEKGRATGEGAERREGGGQQINTEVIVDPSPMKQQLVANLKNEKNYMRNQDLDKAVMESKTTLELA